MKNFAPPPTKYGPQAAQAKMTQEKSAQAKAVSAPRSPHLPPPTKFGAPPVTTAAARPINGGACAQRATLADPSDQLSHRLGPLMPVQHHTFMEAIGKFGLGPSDIGNMFTTGEQYGKFLNSVSEKLKYTKKGLPGTHKEIKEKIRSTMRDQKNVNAWSTDEVVVFGVEPDVYFISNKYNPIKKIPKNNEIIISDAASFISRYILEGMMRLEQTMRASGEHDNRDLDSHQALARRAIRDIGKSELPAGFATDAIERAPNQIAHYRFRPSKGGTAHIMPGPDAVHLGTHESMHYASSKHFKKIFGNQFNEAATEYFARSVLYAENPIDVERGAYGDLIQVITWLIDISAIRRNDLVEAYFNGNTNSMERTLRRFLSGLYTYAIKGSPQTFMDVMVTRKKSIENHWILDIFRRIISFALD